jgi:hypothetical protein
VENTSFSLSLDASNGEYRHFNDQNYSSKPRARHSPLRELKLVMSDLTPRKRQLYHRNAEKCTV